MTFFHSYSPLYNLIYDSREIFPWCQLLRERGEIEFDRSKAIGSRVLWTSYAKTTLKRDALSLLYTTALNSSTERRANHLQFVSRHFSFPSPRFVSASRLERAVCPNRNASQFHVIFPDCISISCDVFAAGTLPVRRSAVPLSQEEVDFRRVPFDKSRGNAESESRDVEERINCWKMAVKFPWNHLSNKHCVLGSRHEYSNNTKSSLRSPEFLLTL